MPITNSTVGETPWETAASPETAPLKKHNTGRRDKNDRGILCDPKRTGTNAAIAKTAHCTARKNNTEIADKLPVLIARFRFANGPKRTGNRASVRIARNRRAGVVRSLTVRGRDKTASAIAVMHTHWI